MLGINGLPELIFWSCITFTLDQAGTEAHLFHGAVKKTCLRGIWNLWERRRKRTEIRSGERHDQPLNPSKRLEWLPFHASQRHTGAYLSTLNRSRHGREIATTFRGQSRGKERELTARKISLSGMPWKRIQHTELIEEAGIKKKLERVCDGMSLGTFALLLLLLLFQEYE